MAATSSIPRPHAHVAPHAGHLALAGIAVCCFALAGGAASHPGQLVPASRGGTPGWLTGPLSGLGIGSSATSFQLLLLSMCLLYGLVLWRAEQLEPVALWSAIVLAHLAFLLGPPLLSADVMGYLDFARLGALHGLDPYTHTALSAPHDAVFPYLGWHDVRSPYGPLWTLFSYALVPLGLPAGLWALKLLAAVSSLGCATLLWHGVARAHSARATALFALNPVLLVFAVGGAHNETLLALLSTCGLVFVIRGREARGALALAAATAVKASAALALPFALLGAGRRMRLTAAAGAALLLFGAIGVAGFGLHGGTFLSALRGQQNLVALHSLPSEVSRGLGLGRLAGGVRWVFLLLLAASVMLCLRQAWRERDAWLQALGWANLAVLICSAWLLPWYGVWALVPAALSPSRRLQACSIGFCFYLVATRLAWLDGLLG